MKKVIYEFSVKQSSYSMIKVRASNQEEALNHLKEDPYWMNNIVWNTDSFNEIEINEFELNDDGSFDIDLTAENKPEVEYGTLVVKKIPENSVIKVTDSSGAIFELKLNDEQMIAAGICNWEVKSNGISLGKGSYDIYPSETNPLFVKI